MLGLFGNKSDHPLATLKSAQQQLALLSKTDAVLILQEIANWIEMLFDAANDFRPDHQLAVLRMLDEAAYPPLQKVIRSYFSVTPANSFQENRLWVALNAYFTYAEQGYLHLIMVAREGDKRSSEFKSSEALICARGIHALFGRLECAAVRGAHIDAEWWIPLADFYDYAVVQQRQNETLQVYAGQAVTSSVSRQFASVSVWYSTSVGTLRPLNLHIAKRLIEHISPSFTVSEKKQPDSLFVFDLAQPVSPARVIDKTAMYPPSTHYVGIGAAVTYLDNLLTSLSKNIIPADVHLDIAYDPEMVAEVVRSLALYGRGLLPVRRQPRRKIKMRINVLDGFFSMLEQTHVDLNLNDQAGEIWEVEDMSVNGLRCVVPAAQANHVRIGTLVGLQPDRSLHWGVGIVRRLSRDKQNNMHVGVRILANKVECVELSDPSGIQDGGYRALLLDRPDEGGGESWLLMKADIFSSNYSPSMRVNGQSFLMLPLTLEEKWDDFDIVCYRKMLKDNSANSGEES